MAPAPETLTDLDLMLFDIPDIGARFYTYVWTLSHVMEACAAAGLPLWVLDRPNPLGGRLADAEGPLLDEVHISTFVGRWRMPVRHSLTVGELARLWQTNRLPDLDLRVVQAGDWRRGEDIRDLDLPFIPPSPNMPSFDAAVVYPGTCLFEGTNLSEGRGTSNPFQLIGAPWLDAPAVAERVNDEELPGMLVRTVEFVPQASKFRGQQCRGIMIPPHRSPRTAPGRGRASSAGDHCEHPSNRVQLAALSDCGQCTRIRPLRPPDRAPGHPCCDHCRT